MNNTNKEGGTCLLPTDIYAGKSSEIDNIIWRITICLSKEMKFLLCSLTLCSTP